MKKLLILVALAYCALLYTNNKDIIEIPSSSIRMRVIAKTNSEKDQKEKNIIKEALEKKIYDITKTANSYNEVDELLATNESTIASYINEVIKNNNINTSFSTNYGYNYFPQKEFKGVLYKAGNYKSYVITLGEGKGKNWWCVLYPPLCLIDEEKSEYEYHSLIKDVLEKYN